MICPSNCGKSAVTDILVLVEYNDLKEHSVGAYTATNGTGAVIMAVAKKSPRRPGKRFLCCQFTGDIAATDNFSNRIVYSKFFVFSVAVALASVTGIVVADRLS